MEDKKNPKHSLVSAKKPNMDTENRLAVTTWTSSADITGGSMGKATQGRDKGGIQNLDAYNPKTVVKDVTDTISALFSDTATGISDAAAPPDYGSPSVEEVAPGIKLIKAVWEPLQSTAVQHAGKHFDGVLGIDIHWTLIPIGPSFNIIPLPLPHPFVGMIFDPIDYITINISDPAFLQTAFNMPANIPLGGSIMLHGRHKATTTTSVYGVLWPSAGHASNLPVYKIPLARIEAPHDSEVYYGSESVLCQGTNMGGSEPQQVLTCMGLPFGDIMLPSTSPTSKKVKKSFIIPAMYSNFASMYVQINTGKPVLVGGTFVPHVYTASEMAMRLAGMFLVKKLMSKLGGLANGALTAFNKHVLRNILGDNSKLVKLLQKWGFDPINFVTGVMMFEWDDFEIQGNTPMAWRNVWYSDSPYDYGMLGKGVFNNWDLYIMPDEEAGIAAWIHPDEIAGISVPIPQIGEEPIYYRACKIWLSRPNEDTWIIKKGLDIYTYRRFTHPEGGEVYKVVRIDYNDGTSFDFTYQGQRLLLKTIKDQNGRGIEALGDKHNRHIAEVYYSHGSLRELQVSYEYDAVGNLIQVWDKHNKAIVFEYNERNLIVKRTCTSSN